jgi:hypothetical protein
MMRDSVGEIELLSSMYPSLTALVGGEQFQEWYDRAFRVDPRPWCWLLEEDLRFLTRSFSLQELKQHYEDDLRNRSQLQQAIYEIHCAAAFAGIGRNVRLHVSPPNAPKQSRSTFDIEVEIAGTTVAVEVKTKHDNTLWNTHRIDKPISYHELSSDALGPYERDFLAESDVGGSRPSTQGIAHSTELRQRIEKCLHQLPKGGHNIVVLGHIEGRIEDLDEALGGVWDTWSVRTLGPREIRLPGGIFSGLGGFEHFNVLNAVVWMRLDSRGPMIIRRSRLFINPYAQKPLPEQVERQLVQAFDRKRVLLEELKLICERLIKSYDPDKIILFGSLATDRVHQWSDIDLVIIKDTDRRFVERGLDVCRITRPNVGVNFFVYTPKEFEGLQQQANFFIIDEVLGEGCVVYDKFAKMA